MIYNKLSHKKYIGMTSRNVLTRFKEHCGKRRSKISQAIQKDGKNIFELKILSKTEKYSIAAYEELKNICALHTIAPHGYNVRCNGQASNFLLTCATGRQLCLSI